MKYLIILLPLFLIVNFAGVATHNSTLIGLSVLIIGIYFAAKAIIKSGDKK